MTPLEYYEEQIREHHMQPNVKQRVIVHVLEKLYQSLVKHHRGGYRFSQLLHRPKKIKGLYLYGPVGAGKTRLLDILYTCLPIKKLRLHFHAFMQTIHHALQEQQGKKNPLDSIAKQWRKKTCVLFLDEFLVTNIADAMILAQLLHALLKRGICLITCTNHAPDALYLHGIQRERFLPAIQLIKNNTAVYCLDSQPDYRLQHVVQTGVYFSPLGNAATLKMEALFQTLTRDESPILNTYITLFNRRIVTQKYTSHIIWFDFRTICRPPRSQRDFLALAKQYDTVFISNIPILQPHQEPSLTSFIHLIDVFYDRKIRLIISADAPADQLYPVGRMRDTFLRTQSRLFEMQSQAYLESTYVKDDLGPNSTLEDI